jgi:SpoVK/Ycf46/Vps4 family AAA+-type ATPase
MARISVLTKLFSAVAAKDWERAQSLAKAIADAEERAGHHAAASALTGALSVTGPRAEQSSALEALSSSQMLQPHVLARLPPAQLDGLELPAAVRRALVEVLKEQKHKDLLAQSGLQARSRLFFHGPPGCGKTVTARAMGTELGMPVFVVRFDALVGSYLGQTGLRLSEIFRFAETYPCVLLVDEVDAVGRRRGKATDIAELDRVVIALMQQLDLVRPAGIIVAASNLIGELDPALLRRFELTLEFPAPSTSALHAYARRQAAARGVKLVNGVRHELSAAQSFADVDETMQTEQRRIILRDV